MKDDRTLRLAGPMAPAGGEPSLSGIDPRPCRAVRVPSEPVPLLTHDSSGILLGEGIAVPSSEGSYRWRSPASSFVADMRRRFIRDRGCLRDFEHENDEPKDA